MKRLTIAIAIAIATTTAAAPTRSGCHRLFHICKLNHGPTPCPVCPSNEFTTLHCNGHPVPCVIVHSNTTAPDFTYCDLDALDAFCASSSGGSFVRPQ
jgi:hypothetical protein